jgi:acetolactate synthase-1/2/3 large subunit
MVPLASEKIRVADYIVRALADAGVIHVFMVTGGGAMHLNDAFACEKRIIPIFNHHEQAGAMAAEGYARVRNRFSVINVTTGPGGLNALNGVFGAYTDSIPMLILSGQVKTETQKTRYPELGLRQLGDQEVDIVSMVQAVTKHCVQIKQPTEVRFELEKALHLLTTGRPGPVWIDVPVDIQGSLIHPDELRRYDPSHEVIETLRPSVTQAMTDSVHQCLEALKKAKRPVILVGNGVRLSGALDQFYALAERLKIPVCTAWLMDFIPSNYPYFCGIQGTIGDRAGNFVVQNSDFLLILGSRLQIRQISYNWQNFARFAYKVHVDIDSGELNKPTLKTDLKICADLKDFFTLAQERCHQHEPTADHQTWLTWGLERKRRYHPVVLERQRSEKGPVNPYHFFERLSKQLTSEHQIVAGNASACVMSFPTLQIQAGQRIFTNAGSASMGYDLPAAFGAAIADPSKSTLCFAGDGSIMMNLQELQTVAHYKPNLKIILINNQGYLSIKATQANFFGRLYGEGPSSGVTFPDFVKVTEAFGLTANRLTHSDQIDHAITQLLATVGPSLLEVMVDPRQTFEPKLSSKKMPDGKMISAPLEDMWPFMERDEFLENMIVEPLI